MEIKYSFHDNQYWRKYIYNQHLAFSLIYQCGVDTFLSKYPG